MHPPLTEAVLDLPIEGRCLHGATLGETLGDALTLVVFLRHFG